MNLRQFLVLASKSNHFSTLYCSCTNLQCSKTISPQLMLYNILIALLSVPSSPKVWAQISLEMQSQTGFLTMSPSPAQAKVHYGSPTGRKQPVINAFDQGTLPIPKQSFYQLFPDDNILWNIVWERSTTLKAAYIEQKHKFTR